MGHFWRGWHLDFSAATPYLVSCRDFKAQISRPRLFSGVGSGWRYVCQVVNLSPASSVSLHGAHTSARNSGVDSLHVRIPLVRCGGWIGNGFVNTAARVLRLVRTRRLLLNLSPTSLNLALSTYALQRLGITNNELFFFFSFAEQ